MANNKGLWVGNSSNQPKKVIGIYIGVNGVPKKVTKGYIGINGAMKQFWPSKKSITEPYSYVFPAGAIRFTDSNAAYYVVQKRSASSSTYTTIATLYPTDKVTTYPNFDYAVTLSNFSRANYYMYKIIAYDEDGVAAATDGPEYFPWIYVQFSNYYGSSTPSSVYTIAGGGYGSSIYNGGTRYGYTWDGWYTADGGNGNKLYSGSSYKFSTSTNSTYTGSKYYDGSAKYFSNNSNNITFYANWTANYYMVDLYPDNRGGSVTPSRIYVEKGLALSTAKDSSECVTTCGLPNATNFTYNGYSYTFSSWRAPGGGIISSSTIITSDYTGENGHLSPYYSSSLLLKKPVITGLSIYSKSGTTYRFTITYTGDNTYGYKYYARKYGSSEQSWISGSVQYENGSSSYSYTYGDTALTTTKLDIQAYDQYGNINESLDYQLTFFRVNIYPNGGTGSNTLVYKVLCTHIDETLSELFTTTRTDYTFDGWYAMNGSSYAKLVTTSTKISEIKSYATEDTAIDQVKAVNIKAKWTQIVYVTVTLYKFGSTFTVRTSPFSPTENNTTYVKYSVPSGTSLSDLLPTSNPTINNTKFKRWYDSMNRDVDGSYIVGSSNLVIYPEFYYRVDINANNATSITYRDISGHAGWEQYDRSSYWEYYVPSGTSLSYILPSNNPTRSGYSFNRWYDGQNSNTTVTSSTTTKSAYMDIYPEWKQNVTVRTITLNANGGSCSYSKLYLESGKTLSNLNTSSSLNGSTVGLPTPTHSDSSGYSYSFTGWYNGNTKYTNSTTVSSNITLTAKWSSSLILTTPVINSVSSATKPVVSFTVSGASLVEVYKWNDASNVQKLYIATTTSSSSVTFGNNSNMDYIFIIAYDSYGNARVSMNGSSSSKFKTNTTYTIASAPNNSKVGTVSLNVNTGSVEFTSSEIIFTKANGTTVSVTNINGRAPYAYSP